MNGLAVGALCSYTKISSVALESVEGDVTSMGVITVNQSSLDVGGSVGTVVRVGSIDVSVTYG